MLYSYVHTFMRDRMTRIGEMRRIEMPEFCVCVRMVRALRAHARAFAVMLGVGVSPLLAGAAFAQEASGAAPVGNALLPRDLSPWGMFLNADVVVQEIGRAHV